jgi:hypothetical protein
MPGHLKTYNSLDSVSSEDPGEVANYPTEFLNTIAASGIPPHELKLKIGAIVILLKNIDSRQGMCNGTRLIVEELRDNVILAAIAAGKHKGRKVFIPRITMSPGDSDLAFTLNRKQFPIMLAFAVTINKSRKARHLIASAYTFQNPSLAMVSYTSHFRGPLQEKGLRYFALTVPSKGSC